MTDHDDTTENRTAITGFDTAYERVRTERGDHDPATLTALWDVASARSTAGDIAGALRAMTVVRDTATIGLGPRAPYTLSAAVWVANWRHALGDPTANDLLRDLVPAAIDTLGADHRDTLLVRHVALTAAAPTADPANHVVLWLRLAADETRILGSDDVYTLSSRMGVARARHTLGDHHGALDEAIAVHLRQRRAFGDHHPETLTAALAIAAWRGDTGDTATARTELDALIPRCATVFGHDDPRTLTARYTRALWTSTEDGVFDRVATWTVLLEDLTRALGDTHPLTADTAHRVADARAEWADWLTEHHAFALDLHADLVLEEHGLDLDPGRRWGDVSDLDEDIRDQVLEEADEVRALAQASLEDVVDAHRAVSAATRAFGHDAEPTLAARLELAREHLAGQQFDAAVRHATRLITDAERVLGAQHPLTGLARLVRDHAAAHSLQDVPRYAPAHHA